MGTKQTSDRSIKAAIARRRERIVDLALRRAGVDTAVDLLMALEMAQEFGDEEFRLRASWCALEILDFAAALHADENLRRNTFRQWVRDAEGALDFRGEEASRQGDRAIALLDEVGGWTVPRPVSVGQSGVAA